MQTRKRMLGFVQMALSTAHGTVLISGELPWDSSHSPGRKQAGSCACEPGRLGRGAGQIAAPVCGTGREKRGWTDCCLCVTGRESPSRLCWTGWQGWDAGLDTWAVQQSQSSQQPGMSQGWLSTALVAQHCRDEPPPQLSVSGQIPGALSCAWIAMFAGL